MPCTFHVMMRSVAVTFFVPPSTSPGTARQGTARSRRRRQTEQHGIPPRGVSGEIRDLRAERSHHCDTRRHAERRAEHEIAQTQLAGACHHVDDRERSNRHHPDHRNRNNPLVDDAALNPGRTTPEQPLQPDVAQHPSDRNRDSRTEQHAGRGTDEIPSTAPSAAAVAAIKISTGNTTSPPTTKAAIASSGANCDHAGCEITEETKPTSAKSRRDVNCQASARPASAAASPTTAKIVLAVHMRLATRSR